MGRAARGIVMNFLYNLNSKIKSNCKSRTFYAHLQQRETNTSNKSFPFPLGLQLKASQACNFTASFMCFRSFGDLSALPCRQPPSRLLIPFLTQSGHSQFNCKLSHQATHSPKPEIYSYTWAGKSLSINNRNENAKRKTQETKTFTVRISKINQKQRHRV